MAGFSDLVDEMDSLLLSELGDGMACYQGPLGGAPASGIAVMLDRNLMQAGPEGMFRSDAVGVSWRKCQLATVVRGGIFTYGAERLVVESIIADDGHMVTAACMVQS